MSVNPLDLKFGTALFQFRDLERMKVFLSEHCFKDKNGKIWLHHGYNLHEFTQLGNGYYMNIPKNLKWKKAKRIHFMAGNYCI